MFKENPTHLRDRDVIYVSMAEFYFKYSYSGVNC